MENQPLQPGEDLRRRFTAEWYNRTLPNQDASVSGAAQRILDTTQRVPCFVASNSSSASPFTAVHISGLFNIQDHQETACEVSTESYNQQKDNWCVIQEQGEAQGTAMVVIHGLTRAFYREYSPAHNYVKWDPGARELVSTEEPSKGRILVHADATNPGLILLDYSGGTSVSQQDWIQYEILSADQEGGIGSFQAQILVAEGGQALNPDDPNNPFNVGDTLTVTDPHNLFPYPTARNTLPPGAQSAGATGSIGYAFLRTPSKSNNNPEAISRWEIETQSYPVSRLRVFVEDCILFDPNAADLDAPATASGLFNYNEVSKQSDNPNADFPYGAYTGAGSYQYGIDIYNPLNFTTVKDSWVWVELDDGSNYSTNNVAVPHGFNIARPRYNIVAVEKPIARWAKVQKADNTWDYEDILDDTLFREGYNPTADVACRPAIVNVAGCNATATGWAFYIPETNEYQPVSTESATLGPPITRSFIQSVNAGQGCGNLEATVEAVSVFCPSGTNTVPIDLGFEGLDVVVGVYAINGELCIQYRTVPVCPPTASPPDACFDLCDALNLVPQQVLTSVSWGYGQSQSAEICFDMAMVLVCQSYPIGPPICVPICDLICECPQFYSLPEICDPPPPECGNCTFIWTEVTGGPDRWELLPGGDNCYPPEECDCPDASTVPIPDPTPDYLDTVTVECVEGPPPSCTCPCTINDVTECLCRLEAISYTRDGITYSPDPALPSGGLPQYDGGCCWQLVMKGTDGVTEEVEVCYQDEFVRITTDNWSADAPKESCRIWNFVNPLAGVSGQVTFELIQPGDDESQCFESGPALLKALVPTRKKLPTPSKEKQLGNTFTQANPDWFKGCGACRKGVEAVMNRWTEVPDEDKIHRVSTTIHRKNKKVGFLKIRWAVLSAARAWFNETGE